MLFFKKIICFNFVFLSKKKWSLHTHRLIGRTFSSVLTRAPYFHANRYNSKRFKCCEIGFGTFFSVVPSTDHRTWWLFMATMCISEITHTWTNNAKMAKQKKSNKSVRNKLDPFIVSHLETFDSRMLLNWEQLLECCC